MKRLRKNIDLDNLTLTILLVEATLEGYGTLKPYLEKILADKAQRCLKERPDVYRTLVGRAENKMMLTKSRTSSMSRPVKRSPEKKKQSKN